MKTGSVTISLEEFDLMRDKASLSKELLEIVYKLKYTDVGYFTQNLDNPGIQRWVSRTNSSITDPVHQEFILVEIAKVIEKSKYKIMLNEAELWDRVSKL